MSARSYQMPLHSHGTNVKIWGKYSATFLKIVRASSPASVAYKFCVNFISKLLVQPRRFWTARPT
jgi:hypothetical protein